MFSGYDGGQAWGGAGDNQFLGMQEDHRLRQRRRRQGRTSWANGGRDTADYTPPTGSRTRTRRTLGTGGSHDVDVQRQPPEQLAALGRTLADQIKRRRPADVDRRRRAQWRRATTLRRATDSVTTGTARQAGLDRLDAALGAAGRDYMARWDGLDRVMGVWEPPAVDADRRRLRTACRTLTCRAAPWSSRSSRSWRASAGVTSSPPSRPPPLSWRSSSVPSVRAARSRATRCPTWWPRWSGPRSPTARRTSTSTSAPSRG